MNNIFDSLPRLQVLKSSAKQEEAKLLKLELTLREHSIRNCLAILLIFAQLVLLQVE